MIEQLILSSETTSLRDLIEAKIFNHLTVVKEITSMAMIEYEEEQTLQTIEDELRNLEFRFELHSDGITYLLCDPEELSAKLLDHNYSSSIILKNRRKHSIVTKKLENIRLKVKLFSKILIKIGIV
jgi:hypothetical protein